MMRNAIVGFGGLLARVASAGLCAFAVLGVSGCSFTTPPLSQVEQEQVAAKVSAPDIIQDGTLTVAVSGDNAPQSMESSSGELTGYDVDVARQIARELGLKVSFVSSSSADSALSSGEADIFIDAAKSTAKSTLISPSVLGDASAIFAKDAGGAPVTKDSLASATIAVQDASSSQDELARAGIEGKQRTFSNVNECFEALVNGEVDYVACDATAGAYLARAYAGVSFAGTIGSTSSTGVAVSTSADKLASAVEAVLSKMEQDGTLAAIHTLWYGSLPQDLSSSTLSGVTVESGGASGPSASSDDGGGSASASSDGSGGGSSMSGDEAVASGERITDDINNPSGD